MASATLVNFDTGLDLVVDGAAGDLIEVGILVQAKTEAANGDFNVATIVSGAEVNRIGGTGTTGTIPAWTMRSTPNYFGSSGSATYVLQSGDISAGSVTLRLLALTGGGDSKQYFANSSQPFKWYVKNYGAPA